MARPTPDPALPWPIIPEAVTLCADKEELRLAAYRCIAGKWTCGWGETDGVGPSTRWTKEFADQRFCDSLGHYSDAVRAMCTTPTSKHEHGALTVLGYNIGLKALENSSVMRLHNADDHLGASRAFSLYNKYRPPGSKKLVVSRGLTIRRAQEAAMYLTPDADQPPLQHDMPQAVAAESPMTASPINVGGTVTAGAGALSLLSAGDQAQQASGILSTVKGMTEQAATFIGLSPPQVLGLALVAAGGWVIWNRVKQRREGWA